jgi:hypothetical protein
MFQLSSLFILPSSVFLALASVLLSGVITRPSFAETDPPNPGGPRPTIDANAPYIISPRDSDVLDRTPRFQWARVQTANSYIVSLASRGRGVFWQVEVEGTEATYDGTPLAAETEYTLTVTLRSQEANRSDNVQTTTFYTLSDDQRETIEAELQRLETIADPSDRGTLLGSQVKLLTDQDLIGDAIDLLDLELVNNPDSLDAICLLDDLFEQVNDTALNALGFQDSFEQYRNDRNLGSCES